MELIIKSPSDALKINMDTILAFMQERPREEIEAFQKKATEITLEKGKGSNFFPIRNWFIETYFPEAKQVKKIHPSFIDRIMEL